MAKKFLTDINIAGGVFDSSGDIGNSGQILSSTGSGVNWINANSAASVVYQDGFTGNGSTTAFTLANSIDNENKTQVYIDGVYQHKDNYSLSGTTLTFSTAPPNSSDIEVISFSSVSSADDILYDTDFASAGLMTTNGSGVYSITTNNSANWNTAYGWGDHSTQSYATQSYVGTQISNLVDSSPSALNTLNELAAALGDDANFSTTVTNSIATKLPLAGGTMTGDITASQSVFNITNNDIRFKTSGAETMLRAVANDAVELMYNNSTKIETTSTGVTVTAEAAVGNGTDGIKLSYSSGNSSGIIDTGFSSTALEFRVGNTQELLINGTNATFAGDVISNAIVQAKGFRTETGSTDYSLLSRNSTNTAVYIQQVGTGNILDVRYGSQAAGQGTSAFAVSGTGNSTFAGNVDVSGSIAAFGDDKSVVVKSANGTINATMGAASSGAVTTGAITVRHGGTTKIVLNANDNSYFNNGNVGIGITSPQKNLQIFQTEGGVGAKHATIRLGGYSTVGPDIAAYRVTGNSNDQGLIFSTYDATNGTVDTMWLTNTGKVGIGVDPSGNTDRLQIDYPSNPTSIRIGDNTTDDCYVVFNTDGNDWSIGTDRSDSNKFKISDYSRVGTNDRFVIDTSGNVGIGTTAPLSKLTVSEGTNQHGIELAPGTLSYLQCYDRATSTYGNMTIDAKYLAFGLNNGAEKIRFTADGYIGIGTTSPSRELDIQAGSGWAEIALRGASGAGGSLEFWTSTTKRAEIFADTEDIVFRNTATNQERMRINSAGNVAIGTTSPAAKLHVENTNAAIVYVKSTVNNQNASIFFNSNSGGTQADRWEIGTNISAGSDLEFFDRLNSVSRMVIQNDGNVGIGTISPSGVKFQTVQTTSGDWTGGFKNYTANGYGLRVDMSNSSSVQSALQVYTGTGTGFVVKNTGNVGIGTISPSSKFEVYGSSGGDNNIDRYARFKASNGEKRFDFHIGGTGNAARQDMYKNDGTTKGVSINAAGSSYFNGGNVGIGVTSPSAKLDVFRTINVTSDNDSGYVNSALILNSTESNARGAGVFMHNTNDDAEFYMGVPYAAGFDKWMVAFKSTTSHTDSTSEEANAKFIVESNGDVLIGGAAIQNERTVSFDVSTYGVVHDNCTTSGAGNGWEFQTFRRNNGNNSVQIGSIVMNGTSGITYATSSDYRLKENVVKLTNALDRIDQLKPSRFNFISDKGRTVDGFLAHEVQDIVPEAIVGTKDEVDEDDNPKYQSIDQSKIVPLLVAAIQELKAEIEILKNK